MVLRVLHTTCQVFREERAQDVEERCSRSHRSESGRDAGSKAGRVTAVPPTNRETWSHIRTMISQRFLQPPSYRFLRPVAVVLLSFAVTR